MSDTPHPSVETMLRRLDWLEQQVDTLREAVITDTDIEAQARENDRRHAADRLARLRLLEESAATAQRERDEAP